MTSKKNGGPPDQGGTAVEIAATAKVQHPQRSACRGVGVDVKRTATGIYCSFHLHRAANRDDVAGAARAGSCGTTYRLALDSADGLGGVR